MKKFKILFMWLGVFVCLSLLNVTYITNHKQKELAISYVSGYTIFIDPGHGGKDNGASFEDVLEDEINLNIAKKVYELLLDLEAKVLISRVSDYDLSDLYATNHKVQDLNKRIKYMKENNADLFVSIHLNSYSNSNVSGAQVFYKNDLQESEDFAKVMQKNLNQLNKKDKVAKKGDYYLLNNSSSINGIIVECGFLSNSEERNKLTQDSYQNDIANHIKDGIVEYLELKNSFQLSNSSNNFQ